jgi:hypothetical protein
VWPTTKMKKKKLAANAFIIKTIFIPEIGVMTRQTPGLGFVISWQTFTPLIIVFHSIVFRIVKMVERTFNLSITHNWSNNGTILSFSEPGQQKGNNAFFPLPLVSSTGVHKIG